MWFVIRAANRIMLSSTCSDRWWERMSVAGKFPAHNLRIRGTLSYQGLLYCNTGIYTLSGNNNNLISKAFCRSSIDPRIKWNFLQVSRVLYRTYINVGVKVVLKINVVKIQLPFYVEWQLQMYSYFFRNINILRTAFAYLTTKWGLCILNLTEIASILKANSPVQSTRLFIN